MKKWIICLLLIASNAFCASDLITKTIQLNYISPKEVVPAIKPLLQTGESVSAIENKLIVHVSPETLTSIRKIIQSVDKPPVVFNIAVHQGDADWLSQSQDAVVYQTSSHSEKGDSQSVQVISGNLARISTGSNVPQVSSVGACGLFGPSVSYERVRVGQGVYILPVLQGSKVKLSIRRVSSDVGRYNEQTTNHENLETTTYAPIGEWVKIGSSSSSPNDTQGDSVSYSAGSSFKDKGTLYLKVTIDGN